MRKLLPVLGLPALCLAALAACGGEPQAPSVPVEDERRVLSDAAEMLPAEAPAPDETGEDQPE